MKSISLTYANALFSLCEEENKTDAVKAELTHLSEIIRDNKEYEKLIDSPTLSLSERLSLIDEAFSGTDEYVVNFIKILCEKKAFHLFSDCAGQFVKLYNKKNNIENVTVITAAPLSESLQQKLITKLEKESGKKILLDLKVDKTLLGGIVLRTENSQTDASVRARLESLRRTIAASYNKD